MRHGWRFVFAAAVLAVALTALAGAASTQASTPPTQTVTVPDVGHTTEVTWTGTIPAGANPTSDCTQLASTPQVDMHTITVQTPATGYTGIQTTFTFQITWTPASGNPQTNDEILTVMSGDNGGAVGNSDTSDTTETVAATNLGAGDYDVLACGFVNSLPQDYTGKLTMTTTAAASDGGSLASADPQGLQFSAAVPADPQRDEAEPLITSSLDGLLYTCGPTGFSSAADYAQVSTDGGDQFHLLGTPPRGQQAVGGGGDCAVATGQQKNSAGNYQYAYAGLGALSGFTTATSPDNGHTLIPGGFDISGGATTEGGAADRQWMTFTDASTVLLAYNQQQPRNLVVTQSTDGGQTYSPVASAAAPNPGFPGPMSYIPSIHTVVMPWTKGEQVNLAISQDNGSTWTDCKVGPAKGGTAGFATADVDSAGNVYVAWSDSTDYHVWISALRAADVTKCSEPEADVAASSDGQPTVTPGFTTPLQMDRDSVRTTVFPWVAAGGAPGRVAVAFYGTPQDGDPNTGTFKAAWDVYVSQSLNVFDASPTAAQVKATTHPFHYDSICLNGLGCDLSAPAGDRSLADFFAITYNHKDGRLSIVFNRTNKKPDDAAGYVATPMVVTQVAGPSNGGGTLNVAGREPLRNASADPKGDALYPYSSIGTTPAPVNQDAGDFTGADIGPDAKTNGFTVTLHVADLSDAALASAAGNGSLVWIWRFTNGWQDAAAVAQWSASGGFAFGYDDYTTDSGTCGGSGPGDKCEIYPGATPIQGSVDQKTGTIKLVVPKSVLHPLTGTDAHGRPAQGAATPTSRFYDGTAFSFKDDSPQPNVQSWMAQLDNTPAFDFLLNGEAPPVTNVGTYRLVVSRLSFAPGAITSSKPVKLRIQITDTNGQIVKGALVYVRGVPANEIAPLPEHKTNKQGWATFSLAPINGLEKKPGLLPLFIRARIKGQPILGGASNERLVAIRIKPGKAAKPILSPDERVLEAPVTNRLTIQPVKFSPSSLHGKDPVEVKIHVMDAKGVAVPNALVQVVGVPFNRVKAMPEVKTDTDGWATVQVTPRVYLQPGTLLTLFVRARVAGEPVLVGQSSRRLIATRVR
jgi:hypothetical protein